MTALASRRMEVDLDVGRMSADALAEGWGDGLPLIAPTEDLVAEFVEASGSDAGESLGRVPPSGAQCIVEKVAINAVMAGAPAESMPLICSSLYAMIDSPLWLEGINATTAAVVPAVIVNGPIRDRLRIPYEYSAFGGAASRAFGCAPRAGMRCVSPVGTRISASRRSQGWARRGSRIAQRYSLSCNFSSGNNAL